MAIVFDFNDYSDVHEAIDMVNEGLLGNVLNWLKDKFKGISGDVDKAIASAEVDDMLDPKTGELTNVPIKSIQNIKDAIDDKNATSETVNAAVTKAFAELDGIVKAGTYYKQSMKFMKDGMLTLMDQSAAIKAAGGAAGATAEEKSTAEGTAQKEATAMQAGISEEMKKRIASFDDTFNKAKENAKKQAQIAVQALLKKSSSESTKLFINNRFATAETVLLLIEYDIKKLRIDPANLADLKNRMVATYKVALDSAKQLQTAVTQEKGVKMTPDAYGKMDINGFVKEYPADTPVETGGDAKDKFMYPYEGLANDMRIVITGYDVNAKTVSVQTVAKDGKLTTKNEMPEPIPFDTFKAKLLAGSGGQAPVKQKGGMIEKPAAAAKPAGAEPAEAAVTTA